MKDKIMLVSTEHEVYDKITEANRFEYFSVSGPGLIRLIQPVIKERLFSQGSNVFIMRLSFLMPWSPPIHEMSRKETKVSNPTRRAPISDEVLSNFGEFLELTTFVEGCSSKFIFTFECYDCVPFFKYAFVEGADSKTMCLKNYMTFMKGMSTPGREHSEGSEIGQQHYDDAQRVLQEFGLKMAEISNISGKVISAIHFHLLKDMNPTKRYRIESSKINEYDFQSPQTKNTELTEISGKSMDQSHDPEHDKMILLSVLEKRLSDDDLRTLCFSVDIEYEDLAGEGKTGKIRELISFFHRRKQISKLKAAIMQLRPEIDLTAI